MLNVECGSLKRLVHPTILASLKRSFENLRLDGAADTHAGSRSSSLSAWARTRDNSSLISTNASNSNCSVGLSRPSLFKSISSCKRRSVDSGNFKAVTDSTQSCGTEMVVALKKKNDPSPNLSRATSGPALARISTLGSVETGGRSPLSTSCFRATTECARLSRGRSLCRGGFGSPNFIQAFPTVLPPRFRGGRHEIGYRLLFGETLHAFPRCYQLKQGIEVRSSRGNIHSFRASRVEGRGDFRKGQFSLRSGDAWHWRCPRKPECLKCRSDWANLRRQQRIVLSSLQSASGTPHLARGLPDRKAVASS